MQIEATTFVSLIQIAFNEDGSIDYCNQTSTTVVRGADGQQVAQPRLDVAALDPGTLEAILGARAASLSATLSDHQTQKDREARIKGLEETVALARSERDVARTERDTERATRRVHSEKLGRARMEARQLARTIGETSNTQFAVNEKGVLNAE